MISVSSPLHTFRTSFTKLKHKFGFYSKKICKDELYLLNTKQGEKMFLNGLYFIKHVKLNNHKSMDNV